MARAGYSLQEQLAALREVLLQAVWQEDTWHGVFALAAAGIERRTEDLVRVCVIQERAADASWAAIGEPFGLSADAARKRWARWELAPAPQEDAGPCNRRPDRRAGRLRRCVCQVLGETARSCTGRSPDRQGEGTSCSGTGRGEPGWRRFHAREGRHPDAPQRAKTTRPREAAAMDDFETDDIAASRATCRRSYACRSAR